MLLRVGRAPSPCFFPCLGVVGLCVKGVMLAIDIASTYRFLYVVHWITDRWWNLLQGLLACNNWLCFADFTKNLLSLLQRLILMTHTTTVILPWSHWEVYLLTFLQRRGAVFIVEEGPCHPCGLGQTAWTLTEKIGKVTFISSRPFHVAIVLLRFEAFFWLSRRIWSIVCKSSFFI